MKRINIQDILDEDNSYFHFTDESHLYDDEQGIGILNGGLSSIPRNRPHTVGDDPKTCNLRNGVEIRDVADILGHKFIETTENFYISSTDENKKNVSDVFDKVMRTDIIEDIIKYEIG